MPYWRGGRQADSGEDFFSFIACKTEPTESQRIIGEGSVTYRGIWHDHKNISCIKDICIGFTFENTTSSGNIVDQIAITRMRIHHKIRGAFFQSTVIKFQVKMNVRIVISLNFHKNTSNVSNNITKIYKKQHQSIMKTQNAILKK